MPNIIEITDFAAPELDIYARLTEGQLLKRHEPDKGVFIAESPKVIERALDADAFPYHADGKEACGKPGTEIIQRCGEIPVYAAEFDVLTQLTGFHLTRGMLCAMYRPPLPGPGKSAKGALVAVCWKCHESHQCRSYIPLSSSPEYGRSSADIRLQQSSLPPRRTGEHGNRFPDSMDLSGQPAVLASGGGGIFAGAGICDSCHGIKR